jgi:hypothetical protein
MATEPTTKSQIHFTRPTVFRIAFLELKTVLNVHNSNIVRRIKVVRLEQRQSVTFPRSSAICIAGEIAHLRWRNEFLPRQRLLGAGKTNKTSVFQGNEPISFVRNAIRNGRVKLMHCTLLVVSLFAQLAHKQFSISQLRALRAQHIELGSVHKEELKLRDPIWHLVTLLYEVLHPSHERWQFTCVQPAGVINDIRQTILLLQNNSYSGYLYLEFVKVAEKKIKHNS